MKSIGKDKRDKKSRAKQNDILKDLASATRKTLDKIEQARKINRKKIEDTPSAQISPNILKTSDRGEPVRESLLVRPMKRSFVEREPEPEEDPSLPPVTFWPPDLGIQIALGDLCPIDVIREIFVNNSVRDIFTQWFPSAEVLSSCDGDGTLRIGLWIDVAANDEERQIKSDSLGSLNLFEDSETIGLFLKNSFVRRFAQAEFNLMPKRIDEYGRLNHTSGPVHLESLSVRTVLPNQIITEIRGYDDRPWPDIDFKVTITDTLEVSEPGSVRCGTNTSQIRTIACSSSSKVHVSEFDKVVAVILGLLTLPAAPIAAYLFSQLAEAASGNVDIDGGLGCALANFANRPIPLPALATDNQRSQIVTSFTRREITNVGVFAHGTWQLCQRFPRLIISGPRSVEAYVDDATVTLRYSVTTQETYGEVSPAWSAGNAHVHTPNGLTTLITFPLFSEPSKGSAFERTVSVSGTDGDGRIPRTSIMLRIRLTTTPPSPGHPRDREREPEAF